MWKNLRVVNEWENITTYAGGTRERPGPKIGVGPLKVRWPDGTEETVSVFMVRYSRTVCDMGHDYTVVGERPHIAIRHNGATMQVSLEEAKVKVWVP